MTDAEFAAIQVRANAATLGPWKWVGDIGEGECIHGTDWTGHGPDLIGREITKRGKTREYTVLSGYGYDAWGLDIGQADAEFIAHAREDIPRLLTYIQTLRAMLTTDQTLL